MEEKSIDTARTTIVQPQDGLNFIFVPDDLFFFKTFEADSKLSSKKVLECVFNQIVENSPFPIEQLMWGVVPKEGGWVWYAGLKDRILGHLGETSNEKHVLPYAAFAILLEKKDECCCFSHNKNVSLVANGAPIAFLSKDFDDCASLKDFLANKNITLPIRRISIKSLTLGHKNRYKCTYLERIEAEGPTEVVTHINCDKIWLADIREKELLKTLKHQQSISHLSEQGMKWSCGLLAFALLFQSFLWLGQLGLLWKQKVRKRLQPVARKIEEKDSLVRQMQNMIEQEIRPFELLGLLNSYRPNNIYFTATTIDNAHNIIVEAVSETAMAVKEYSQNLIDSGCFESVRVDNLNVSSQGTKFKLSCDFKEKQGHYFLNLEETL